MRKPWWVRAIAYIGWLIVGFVVAGLIFTPSSLTEQQFYSMAMALLVIAALLFVAWSVVSGIVWVINRATRTNAAIQRDVLGDLAKKMRPQAVTSVESNNEQVWDNPATKIKCDGCGRYHAMLYCNQHGKFLCFPCVARHDSDTCWYKAAGRAIDDSHKQPSGPKAVGNVLFR